MRVLVTGSSGHVGSAVVARLAEAGHHVIGLGRHGGAAPGTAEAVDADLGDPRVQRELHELLPGFDAVVHAAAALDKGAAASELTTVNCAGTQALLSLGETRGTPFIFISGVAVIGAPRVLPVAEDHPVDPPTAYHASKLFGERLTTLAARRGLPAISLRLTSPAGPGTPPGRILSTFVDNALAGRALEVAGKGTRRQDYVDVRDVAAAVERCLEKRASGLMNVAAGRSVSNGELARRCVEVLGSSSEVQLGGVQDPQDGNDWDVSIDLARERLGWAPARGLDDVIRGAAGAG